MLGTSPGASSPETMTDRVRRLTVRLVQPDEIARWTALMAQHHYLGRPQLVGEIVRYVATVDDTWVALLGWTSAALKVRVRDHWIGWTPAQQRHRLRYVANNARFCVLPGWAVPNLASRTLALTTRRLAADWQQIHGHPVVLAETFVDPHRFAGTCYKAAGWECLGQTRGFGRHGTRWEAHAQPKTVWVRPLTRPAQAWLTAAFDPPSWQPRPAVWDLNQLPLRGPTGLLTALATVPDPRHRRGIRHSQLSILAVAVGAVLSGARSLLAIADWAQALPADALAQLGCRRSPRTGHYEAPSEPTIRRTLEAVDADQLDAILDRFLAQAAPDRALAVDGKTLRGSGHGSRRPQHLLAAVLHQSGVVVAQHAVDGKSNEIPVARQLLTAIDLTGKIVTADAMHTQTAFAATVVDQHQADYVLIVKENQRLLKKVLATQITWDFSPSDHDGDEGAWAD